MSKILHSIYDAPLAYAVGPEHVYSNFNYALIAEIVTTMRFSVASEG